MMEITTVKEMLSKAQGMVRGFEDTRYANLGELARIAKTLKDESSRFGINEQLLTEEEREILEWLKVYAEVVDKIR